MARKVSYPTTHVSADVTFAIIPTWLLDSSVSAAAIRLYATLASYADNTTKLAFPSRARLADRMRCSRDTIDRAQRELVAVGAITVRRRWHPESGAPTSSEYRVHVQPAGRGVAADLRPPTRTDAAGDAAPVRHRTRSIELEGPPAPDADATGELSAHHGQHARCRACGTNPRATAAAEQAQRSVKPPWCGECDETSRLLDVGPATVARCAACHPLEVGR